MRVPILSGTIDRRILINYRINPAALSGVLPAPFRPKLVRGVALGGICLIRLKAIRPRALPAAVGLRSENAAHRFAVEWGSAEERREGVYIPRRDTSSCVARAVGGRIFPGVHRRATFDVAEHDDHFSVAMTSDDGQCRVNVEARVAPSVPKASAFASLEEATSFFEAGSVGLSDARRPGDFDALRLRCPTFRLTPLHVERVSSSFFDDHSLFPEGSVRYDSAFLMRGLEHEWHGLPSVCAAA